MREILFKAKRVDNGEWVEGALVQVDDSEDFYYIMPRYNLASSLSPLALVQVCAKKIIPKTLCEYTNLTDKNGKRIWENDIVKAPIYHDVGCYPYTETKIVKVQIPNIYRMSIDGDFEVIGNSIDNPELLTAERSDND